MAIQGLCYLLEIALIAIHCYKTDKLIRLKLEEEMSILKR
jgi:hypothetical protein